LGDDKLNVTFTNYKIIYDHSWWIFLTSFLLRILIIFVFWIEKLTGLLDDIIVFILKIVSTLPPWIWLLVLILLIVSVNYKHILIFKIFLFLLFCIYDWFYLALSISKFAFSFFVVLFDFCGDLIYGIASSVLVQKVEIAVRIIIFDFWILIILVLL
jgi:hypothetical protein